MDKPGVVFDCIVSHARAGAKLGCLAPALGISHSYCSHTAGSTSRLLGSSTPGLVLVDDSYFIEADFLARRCPKPPRRIIEPCTAHGVKFCRTRLDKHIGIRELIYAERVSASAVVDHLV